MKIIRTIEYDIPANIHQQIIELRNSCFSENVKTRSYFKQLPHFRYLVFADNLLVAHMGVDHRVIRVGNSIFTIFGVIDLCVVQSHRRRGIASKLLILLTELAREKSVDFLFLVSHNDAIYLNNGFKAVSQYCSWLGIEDDRNCGVLVEKIEENFMVKQTGDRQWVNEPIDLLGYMF